MTINSWQLDGYATADGGNEDLGFQQRRLNSGRSEGVTVVSIHIGGLHVDVVPTRGMSIHRATRDGLRFGWDSPIQGPVHPQWVPIAEPSGLGWLDGFDEMMVRCGLQNNGAPQHSESGALEYPLHGRIGNLPATETRIEIDSSNGLLRLSGVVYESRFHFSRLKMTTTYTLDVNQPDRIAIHDRVENVSNRMGGVQLLYHTNIGRPILEDGAKVVAPVQSLSPRNEHSAKDVARWDSYLAPDSKYAEQVYFMKLAANENHCTTVLLHDRDQEKGFSMEYDIRQLPCFTLWKNTVGESDGYVTGLEPGLNFPNRRNFEQENGRVLELGPGEARDFSLSFGFHCVQNEVSEVLERINQISTAEPTIFDSPQTNMTET